MNRVEFATGLAQRWRIPVAVDGTIQHLFCVFSIPARIEDCGKIGAQRFLYGDIWHRV